MPILPPDVLAKKMKEKYEANTAGKGSTLVRELTRVIDAGVDPLSLAAANYQKMKAKLKAFLDSDLWPEIMKSIDRSLYRSIIEQVAASAYDTAVSVKKVKQQRFADQWAPILVKHQAKIHAMPNVTDADRERRMIENLRGLKRLKGVWRRGGAPPS